MAIETNAANGPWLAGGPATVRGFDPGGPPYLGFNGQFGSFHRNGSEALFADGSVRFLSDTVDPKVFAALATIAGGEAIDPDIFDD
jgi:prepilin-type processing-associated H-X9-DG protein